MAVSRRNVLRGAAAVGIAGVLPPLQSRPARAAVAQAVPGWPRFTYQREVINRDDLNYNPTNELIFPSIRLMEGRASNPLGRYYLYYAPHDPPGGICVAFANDLAGPFTEHEGNPIVAKSWPPHYDVSHVSSPHVLWNESNRTFYLYFHGENTETRLARSSDGLNWTYDSVVVTVADLPEGVTETSYARTFRHAIPGRNNTYTMLFMGNQADTRKIFFATSPDQRDWTVQQTPLISPAPDGEEQIGNPHLVLRDGAPHVIYNGASGPIYVTRVGTGFDEETHLGVFHQPLGGFPDNGRCASPAFASEGGTLYMYYEAGIRLDGRIALATAPAAPGFTWPL